jgi:hypothetical protein
MVFYLFVDLLIIHLSLVACHFANDEFLCKASAEQIDLLCRAAAKNHEGEARVIGESVNRFLIHLGLYCC